jgi:hypothetical protein
VTASGEVIASETSRGAVGVRFTRMPAISRERIGRFLSAQATA